MSRYALLGTNIKHSRSPMLMKFLGRKFNIDISYDLVEIQPTISDSKLLDIITSYDGVNVTMPFKMRVADILNVDYAVNTISVKNKTIKSFSTDGIGVVLALENKNIDVDKNGLIIIGCGGASYSAIKELSYTNKNIKIVNRTQEKADILSKKYQLQFDESKPYGILSFVPLYDQIFGVSEEQIKNAQFVFDANYSKGETLLLQTAKNYGVTTIGGENMHFFQGVVGFCLLNQINNVDVDKLFMEYENENSNH